MFTFLLAELPHLDLNQPPPLSLAEFDETVECAMIPCDYRRQLALYDGSVKVDPQSSCDYPEIFRKYLDFERFLRTCIAGIRSRKLGKEISLPETENYYHYAAVALDAAAAVKDPLEREKIVDNLRWNAVDEIAAGCEFDFNALCAYKIKLVLLCSRRHRNRETGLAAFNSALESKISHDSVKINQ